MNDRIQELSVQAKNSVPHGIMGVDKWIEVYNEKFAELIVRECIDVIGEDNYTMLTGKAYCTELKRHFGVEE